MEVTVVPLLAREQLHAMYDLLEVVFADEVGRDVRDVEIELFERSLSFGAYDGDHLVATTGAFLFDLHVPGGTVPAAGVTTVGVLSTHRRRGLLTQLMTHQLHAVRDVAPVAVLWASESVIYGRFGYGLAACTLSLAADRVPGAARTPLEPGAQLRLVDPQQVRDELAAVYETQRRPGAWRRSSGWWDYVLLDTERRREGASPLRCVVYQQDGATHGYALYRVKENWGADELPASTVRVREVLAATPAAYAAVWRFLLDIDLTTRIEVWNRPVDDPLLHLLADPRRTRPRLRDNVWVRVVDVPAALEARTYGTAIDAVLEVRDELCPWNAGRWRLTGDASDAKCQPTSEAPDVELAAVDLGAVYLGGTRLTTLAAAGRVRARDDARLTSASRAFAGDVEPWCPMVF